MRAYDASGSVSQLRQMARTLLHLTRGDSWLWSVAWASSSRPDVFDVSDSDPLLGVTTPYPPLTIGNLDPLLGRFPPPVEELDRDVDVSLASARIAFPLDIPRYRFDPLGA